MYRALKKGKVIAEGATQSDLARIIGVSEISISKYASSGRVMKSNGYSFEKIEEKETKLCPCCGKTFDDTTPGFKKIYCTSECRSRGPKSDIDISNIGEGVALTTKKRCQWCEQLFVVSVFDARKTKYCSDKCKKADRAAQKEAAAEKKKLAERRKGMKSLKRKKITIEDISREALEQHKSYGEYVMEIELKIQPTIADAIRAAKAMGVSYQEFKLMKGRIEG